MGDKNLEKKMFPFDKPLTSRDRKKFVELLSLGILQYCYGDIYNECEVKDAPDIQHRNKLIGVEVVEAISNEDAICKVSLGRSIGGKITQKADDRK